MGQAVATIKAATTCLESSSSFLEQATAVATQALENAIPAKEYFMELVGENGTVVSTAQELKDAVNSGKETICVYGKIDYFVDETLTLHDGQKLVGTEYFTGYSGKEKFSRIYFENNVKIDNIKVGNDNVISDLYISSKSVEKHGAILKASTKVGINIKNIDFYLFSDDINNSACKAIEASFSSSVNILGNINLETGRSAQHDSGYAGFHAFTANNESVINVDANINARIEGTNSFAFVIGGQNSKIEDNSVLNINASSTLNLWETDRAMAFCAITIGSSIYINDSVFINSNLDKLTNAISTTNIYTSPDANINLNKTFEEDDFILENDDTLKEYDKQYANIISQYDAVINDGSYKGVNL